MKSLVIGGTGPTGHFIVNGLRARGHTVTILHTGQHELPEIPDEVEHIHTDPWSADALASALEGRSFEFCIAMYGRLRAVAETMKGRCGRFLSIGGVPAYRGFMNPELFEPPGLPVPTAEDAPLVREEAHDTKGYRIVRTEERVFVDFHFPHAVAFDAVIFFLHKFYSSEARLARTNSRLSLAIFSSLISLGQAASHSPWFEQLPNSSFSIACVIRRARRARSG